MSSAFNWAPGGCCCGVPYEAWATMNGDKFAIHNFTQLIGEPTDSIDDFAPDDEYNGEEYGVAMEVGGYVYLSENDTSDTEFSVAKYDANTGALQWEHTVSVSYQANAFRLSGHSITSERMSINPTQAFVGNGIAASPAYTLFESSGTTSYTAAPNTTSDPYDGLSADWIPTLLASHDYPMACGYRIRIANYTPNYVDTDDLGGGSYRHNFSIDYDVVFDVGFGTFDPSTGDIGSVTTVDSLTTSYTGVSGSITDSNPSPPSSPPASSFTLSTNNFTFNGSRPYRPIEVFHSIDGGSDYIMGYTVRQTDSGGTPTYIQKFIIDGNEAESWSDSSNYLATIRSGAIVHRQPAVHSEAVLSYTLSTGEDIVAGFGLDGVEDWNEDINPGTWHSVNDTWALLEMTIPSSTTLPDGRSWSVSYTFWMVRLDDGEWEPCRRPFGPSSYNTNIHLDGMDTDTGDGSNVDLLKTVQHPYGPPDVTYDTPGV